MSGMSLRDRVCQLFVYTIAPDCSQANRNLLRRVVEDYRVGGLLFSGGAAGRPGRLTNEAQDMARVPLLLTFDGEWGACHAPEAKMPCPTPATWYWAASPTTASSPSMALRWPGSYANWAYRSTSPPWPMSTSTPATRLSAHARSGNTPRRVARHSDCLRSRAGAGRSALRVQHFPGHGDTEVDSHKTLPTLDFSRQRLDSVELLPFRHVIESRPWRIMVGHLSVPAIEPEAKRPSSLSHAVVTGLLAPGPGASADLCSPTRWPCRAWADPARCACKH